MVVELAEGNGALLHHCPPRSDRSAVALLSSLQGLLVPHHLRTAVFQLSMGCWRSLVILQKSNFLFSAVGFPRSNLEVIQPFKKFILSDPKLRYFIKKA